MARLKVIPYTEIKKTFPKPMVKFVDKNTTLHKQANNQDEVISLLKDGYEHQASANNFILGLMIFLVRDSIRYSNTHILSRYQYLDRNDTFYFMQFKFWTSSGIDNVGDG